MINDVSEFKAEGMASRNIDQLFPAHSITAVRAVLMTLRITSELILADTGHRLELFPLAFAI